MTDAGGRIVRVTRHFSATADRVFDAWLDPTSVRSWLFATPTSEKVSVELDPRVGGTFRIVDRRDGVDVPHVGEYLQIERPRRLVFTVRAALYSPHTYRVTIDIEPERTGCTLVLTQALHAADDPGFAESLRLGWIGNLNALAFTLTDQLSQTAAKARVTRRFSASAERVFDAWLDPRKIARWFAPGLGPIVRVDVDARVGGRFSIVQRRGADDLDHIGEYLELERPRRLVFTWGVVPDAPDSRVVIDIAPDAAGGCELTLVHEMPEQWAEFAPRSANAWEKMTAEMAKVLE